MDRDSFLLEIGCEELPVAYIDPALDQLADRFTRWLAEERLEHGAIKRFATPRRLALLIEDLQIRQEDFEEEVTGPPMSRSYQDGEPTKAALGFAKGHGLSLDALYSVETAKGEYLAGRKTTVGRDTGEILTEGIAERIAALQFPKTMTWGDGALSFARPIRWICAMLGEKVLPCAMGVIKAAKESRGHRTLAPGVVKIPRADDYEQVLERAHVQVDPQRRRERCLELARACAAELGGKLVEDAELAHTVNYLLEEPAALAGRFQDEFLDLPREVVSTAMKSHQRYFSVEDEQGRLLPGFVVLLNGARPNTELVRRGNEMVLQARLEDARFYWDEDRKQGLSGLAERLGDVVWLEGFGSLAERGERLARLCALIADSAPGMTPDRQALEWAARHCKADLASEMIKDGKEFTQLLGYMGQEYARAEGVADERASILFEHTLPRHAKDRLPESAEGVILALADRLDAVAGFWAAGFAPTGSKDPYALRRMCLALIRLMLEKELPLCLSDLLDAALGAYPQADRVTLRGEILGFILGRLRGRLEEDGIAPDIFDAVVDTGETRVLDLRARALALNGLRGDPAFEQLVIGARRVVNILKKEEREPDADQAYLCLEDWAATPPAPRFGFLEERLAEDAETELYEGLKSAAPGLRDSALGRDYEGAYRTLAALGPVIDAYFDRVMVNAEDTALRANRLAFLQNLAQVFLHFAGFSRVVLEGEREEPVK